MLIQLLFVSCSGFISLLFGISAVAVGIAFVGGRFLDVYNLFFGVCGTKWPWGAKTRSSFRAFIVTTQVTSSRIDSRFLKSRSP